MSKISVIIPIYNIEPYLSQCLESVVNQTLKDIQIICVNDGSTDNSKAIVERYQQTDNRIILIDQENKGISEARNAGLNCSDIDGKYVYFLDGDDTLNIYALEILFNKAEKEKLDILLFKAVSFSDNKILPDLMKKYEKYYDLKGRYDGIMSGSMMMSLMQSKKEYRVSVALSLTNREYIESIKLRFIPGIIYEDNSFTFEKMIKADRVAYIDKALYNRRVRAGSIVSSSVTSKNTYDYFVNYLTMKQIFDDTRDLHPFCEEMIREIIQNMLKQSMIKYKELSLEEQLQINCSSDSNNQIWKLHIQMVQKDADIFELTEKLNKLSEEHRHFANKSRENEAKLNTANALVKQVTEENNKLLKLLQKSYDEKAEVERLLQKATDEKNGAEARVANLEGEVEKQKNEKNKYIDLLKDAKKEIGQSQSSVKKLRSENETLNSDSEKLHSKIEALNTKSEMLNAEIKKQKKENSALEKNINSLKSSGSYKIGRFLTWIPRKIKNLLVKKSGI